MSLIRNIMGALLLAGLIGGLTTVTPAHAQDARIKLEIFRVGFIVGAGGGSGTLIHKGKGYPLKVGGVSIGATIGASSAELIGNVYNLKNPQDIAGTYSAVGGSAVLAGGAASVELKNSKGVRMLLSGRSIGLELSLDLSGLRITMR